jgi:hypothetical protein
MRHRNVLLEPVDSKGGHRVHARLCALTLGVVVSAVACGGGDSRSSALSTPTAPSAPPAPATATVSGQVVSINGGAPISGIAVDAGGVTATSDGQGMFTVTLPTGSTAERVSLTAPQILSRTVFLMRTTRHLTLDVIRTDDGAFDAGYYREFVRNELESTTGPHPVRRWTRSSSFYIKTVDEAGGAVDAQFLDMAEGNIRLVVPLYTGGRFDVAAIERGVQSRETTPGWITVKWLAGVQEGLCGRAHVGRELGGTIELAYENRVGCGCDGLTIRHKTVRHEVGHAMGFWHTSRQDDVMGNGNFRCFAMPTGRETFHASIAYSRPVGNTDPDTDPSTSIRIQPVMVTD